jgi:hypothetical protein
MVGWGGKVGTGERDRPAEPGCQRRLGLARYLRRPRSSGTGAMMYSFRKATAVFWLALVAFTALTYLVKAYAHDWKRPDLDAWYGSLKNPRSGSHAVQSLGCCSKNDCHETEAEIRGTEWWARLGIKRGLEWEAADWVKVPTEAILLNQSNPTASAVICHSSNFASGPYGHGLTIDPKATSVWCFVPPTES